MARITWLGEGDASSPTITWFGHELRAGEAVEIADARLLAKARGSRFFKVEEGAAVPVTQWREPATEADPADELPPPVTRPKYRPGKRR